MIVFESNTEYECFIDICCFLLPSLDVAFIRFHFVKAALDFVPGCDNSTGSTVS